MPKRGLFALAALLFSQTLLAKEISIGVVSNGLLNDSIYVAAELAKQQGIDVKVVEFTDWILPNTAVLNGDIDINYFQHALFLQQAEQARGFKLTPLAYGVGGRMGIYSSKYEQLEQVPENSKVGIPDDPVNQGRSLQLLKSAGLIDLPEGLGFKASLFDISDNPRNLQFVELSGPQLPRIIQDVAFILSYPHYVQSSGVVKPDQYILLDDDRANNFALRFVVNPKQENNQDIRRFIRIYQDAPEVKENLKAVFGGNTDLYRLSWQDFPPLEITP